ncbi:MAG TPA: GNAT family N-acetyltransferase, partial [Phycisphaerae bacterium]|nr:GNAT family N-acetyltransferase [Phycisphaerae bacterium]
MITVVDHPDQCRALWLRLVPPEGLFDLWEVRVCFQEHYGYQSRFLVAENGSGPTGLLALSEIADHGYWGFFPGETYHGKTWLEQNRLLAATPDDRLELLAHCPDPAHLRYVSGQYAADGVAAEVDEVNYLFRPADYGGSFERYLQAFSGKSRKRLRRELDELEARGVSYRYDDPSDIDRAFAMNLELFGDRSYFADERFLSSFRGLCHMLGQRGWLRVTALLLGGRIAAVD